jgi:hypothetical protein
MYITSLIFTLYMCQLMRYKNLMYPIVLATFVHVGGGGERARQKTELQISIGVKEKII